MLTRIAKITKADKNKGSQGCGEIRTLTIASGLLYDTAIILLGIYPREMKHVHTKTCVQVFIIVLFIKATAWKQPKCPSTHEWTNKMWYIYTVEYYSSIKRNEVPVHHG